MIECQCMRYLINKTSPQHGKACTKCKLSTVADQGAGGGGLMFIWSATNCTFISRMVLSANIWAEIQRIRVGWVFPCLTPSVSPSFLSFLFLPDFRIVPEVVSATKVLR